MDLIQSSQELYNLDKAILLKPRTLPFVSDNWLQTVNDGEDEEEVCDFLMAIIDFKRWTTTLMWDSRVETNGGGDMLPRGEARDRLNWIDNGSRSCQQEPMRVRVVEEEDHGGE